MAKKNSNIQFNMVNEKAIERLRKSGTVELPQKKISVPKDMQWNMKTFNSKLIQGLERGDSVQKISKSILPEIMSKTDFSGKTQKQIYGKGGIIDKNIQSSIRNARTMVTAAENHGRLDSMKELSKQGVVMKKYWMATPDDRTRPSHVDIDGEEQDIDVLFSNGCMYPGDGRGPAEEVWMCRCSMSSHILGFKRDDGTISEVQYDRDRTLHEEQMEEIKGKVKKQESAYDFIGEPTFRPDPDDFGGLTDAYYKARDEYRQKTAERKERVEKWYDNNVNKQPMSIEELREWCNKNDCVIYGSLDGLDGVALRNYIERHEQLSKDFPIVKEYHKKSGHQFEIAYNPKATFEAEASHGMTFGGSYSDYRQQVIYEAMKSANGVDFVFGENPAVRIFDHEFGHQVYDAMKYGKDKDYMNSTREELQRRIDMKKDLIDSVFGKKGISDYAKTNDDELFAEAFAAWYGGEKTAFAKAFEGFLRRWM